MFVEVSQKAPQLRRSGIGVAPTELEHFYRIVLQTFRSYGAMNRYGNKDII
jgi:hypothetical protein